MSEKIRVAIVDDLVETRENVRKLLQFEQDIEVIGQAGTGEEAILLAQEKKPDVMLMDINMPGVDGINASQKITDLVPRTQIIIMSVQSDSDYLRRAMLAGAKDFLTKPFGGDQLVAAIHRVYARRPTYPAASASTQAGQSISQDATGVISGKVVVVFSPKGGSGCSTIAIITAISLADHNHKTILVDASLQFGDVAVMLNMKPLTSVVDLSTSKDELDDDLISSVVQVHLSGLDVLMAPPRPEMADVVTTEHMVTLLARLTEIYEYIIVDTSSAINDTSLAIMDAANAILLIAQPNLPSLKNASRFINLTERLNYESRKIWLVINGVTDKQRISVKNITNTLRRPVIMTIPEDIVAVSAAANRGKPLVMGATQKKPVSQALEKLAGRIVRQLSSDQSNNKLETKEDDINKSGNTGILRRLLKR